ncbi:Phage protein [Campylobacter hyointestinalis subsp. hyointestinalis]|uniref:Phage protein n=1 Tax=Campylobacter hyointestinalis subsp. hyointestinalis TaxID=91352 RepID=A0A0S4SNP7_CAMHY|nr:phage terminase large subunit [Campylobacter hyointestinalis]CUU88034.1 Phage protein [Campylobacter hyointestinalis subsp. hyointestinalis]
MSNNIEQLRYKLKGLKRIADTEQIRRIKSARTSFADMVQTYFRHHVRLPESSYFRREFYKNEAKLTAKNRNLLFKAYRGAAKTTLISRLWVLFNTAVKAKKRNVIIISATINLSRKTLEFIKNELEENELFVRDFGIVKGEKWTEDEIVFYACDQDNANLSSKPKMLAFKISAYGAGKKIRGENWRSFRPDLIIGDDLENDENVKTKAQRDKMYEWFEKVVMKLPARDDNTHNIIVVGTTLHHDSLLSRLEARRDFLTLSFPLVRQFPSNLEDDKWDMSEFVLDDSSLNKQKYKDEYLSSRTAFMSEYQNEPLSKDDASFGGYETFDVMPHCDAYYLGIDPALGKAKGDYFAVAILGLLGGKFYASVRMYKLKATLMIDRLLEIYLSLIALNRPIKIAIETIQFQEFFKDTLENKAREMGIYLPIIELKNNVAKELRIDSLAPHINKAQILIDKSALTFIDELDTYPKSAHDDGLDALEMAWRIAKVPNFDYEKANEILQRRQEKKKILERLTNKNQF